MDLASSMVPPVVGPQAMASPPGAAIPPAPFDVPEFAIERLPLLDDVQPAHATARGGSPLGDPALPIAAPDGPRIEAIDAPGHLVRSAEEMSRMAPFTDGGRTVDRTNWSTTVISYYPYGGAIALALDLTLRERTDNRVSLDDFMRAMWRRYGTSAAIREGYVDRPYTAGDVEATLAAVAGDAAFARDFFARYIQGHDIADYAKLLAPAGFAVKQRNAGRAWLGDVRFESGSGLRVSALIAPGWPIYAAGIDEGDVLQEVDGHRVAGDSDVAAALQRHKPGDVLAIAFTDRSGAAKTGRVTLAEDPHIEVVSNDASLTAAQKQFRDRWLGSKTH